MVIGNSSQVDLINIDGLSHNFVDTFYYWSLSVGKPILDVKVSIKSNPNILYRVTIADPNTQSSPSLWVQYDKKRKRRSYLPWLF